MKKNHEIFSIGMQFVVALAVGAALWGLGAVNFLLFHAVAEFFSITVAAALFLLAWNLRKLMDNGYLLFLGIAYLFVAIIDLIHTLAYKGMGVFPGYYGADLAAQFWIAGRGLETLSLLVALVFVRRQVRPGPTLLAYAGVTTLLILSIFRWDIFPTCFVEETGLAPFKIYAEYVICLILLVVLGLMFRLRRHFTRPVLVLMSGAVALTVLSELAFTRYVTVYGNFNVLGHLLKVASFYLVYRAIVVTGVRRPYEMMFQGLNERERQLRQLVEQAPAALALFDTEMRYLAVSDRWLADYGLSRADIQGRLHYERTPGLSPRWREMPQRCLAGAVERIEEDRFERRDGQTRWMQWEARPWYVDTGTIGGIIVFSEDITQRKQTEEAIRRAKEQWEETFDTVPDCVAILDSNHRILRANRAMAQKLGVETHQCVGKRCYEALHCTGQPPENCPHAQTCRDGREHTAEVFEPHLGGHFLVSTTPRFDAAGKLVGSVHVARDITAHKQAEQALRQTRDELERRVEKRTAELKQRAEQLALLSSELTLAEHRERQRLGEVLHDDLQQILIGMKFHLDMAANQAGCMGHEKLVEILAQTDAMLMESIRKSRNLSHELSPPLRDGKNLSLALEWLAARMSDQHAFKVSVKTEGDPEPELEAVRIFVYKAVQEMLFNVVKHSGVREAQVSVRQDDDKLEVAVADRGRGFDPETVFNGETSTGLGLFSIRERVELLGGNMKIDSKLGEGSTLLLTIPTEPAPAAAEQVIEAVEGPRDQRDSDAQPWSQAELPAVSALRVLVVDDHHIVRQGLRMVLSQQDDIKVVGDADNGKRAVAMVQQERPDVVVMDVSMPIMDGVEATQIIKREWPSVRIIGLSMYDQDGLSNQMLAAGAETYLVKTGRPKELLDAIRHPPTAT